MFDVAKHYLHSIKTSWLVANIKKKDVGGKYQNKEKPLKRQRRLGLISCES